MTDDLLRQKGEPEPVFWLVLRHEIAPFSREAQNRGDLDLTLDKRELPLVLLAVGFGHPATIDQDGPPVGQGERGDNMKSGIALICAAGHEDFLCMVEAAGKRQPAEFHFRPDLTRRQVDWCGGGAALEILDELILPFQTLHLPGAKPQKHKQSRKREKGRP